MPSSAGAPRGGMIGLDFLQVTAVFAKTPPGGQVGDLSAPIRIV